MTTRLLLAEVVSADGRVAAIIEAVSIGGGERVQIVDNEQTTIVSPKSQTFHARLQSVDPFTPDILTTHDTWDEAVAAGEAYATRLDEYAAEIAAVQQRLTASPTASPTAQPAPSSGAGSGS